MRRTFKNSAERALRVAFQRAIFFALVVRLEIFSAILTERLMCLVHVALFEFCFDPLHAPSLELLVNNFITMAPIIFASSIFFVETTAMIQFSPAFVNLLAIFGIGSFLGCIFSLIFTGILAPTIIGAIFFTFVCSLEFFPTLFANHNSSPPIKNGGQRFVQHSEERKGILHTLKLSKIFLVENFTNRLSPSVAC